MIDDKIEELLQDSFNVIKKESKPISPGDLLRKIVGYLEARGISNSYSKHLGVFRCKRAEYSGGRSLINRQDDGNLEIDKDKCNDRNIGVLARRGLIEIKDPIDLDSYGLYKHLHNYILTR